MNVDSNATTTVYVIGKINETEVVSHFPECRLVSDPNEAEVVLVWISSPQEARELLADTLKLSPDHTGFILLVSPKRFPEIDTLYQHVLDFTGLKTPVDALRFVLATKTILEIMGNMCESPAEKAFWDLAKYKIRNLRPQYEIGPYRLDFGIERYKVGIEIDGHEYHKTKEQRTRDAARERHIEALGWRVIRFTGSEIYQDTRKCVTEAILLTLSWIKSESSTEQSATT